MKNRTLTACPEHQLERGPNGRKLCRWCKTETKPPRRTFCADECVHEWKIRSNPRYARRLVWKRDQGICQLCGLDIGEFELRVLGIRWRLRRRERDWERVMRALRRAGWNKWGTGGTF